MDRKGVGAAIVVLVLGIAGCGGSGSLSRAELTKQANAICKHRTATIAALQKRNKGNMTSFMTAALPIADKSLDQLGALKPPASLKAKYDLFVAGERSQIAQVRNALAALRAHRRPGRGESVDQLHRQGRITRELGLTACV